MLVGVCRAGITTIPLLKTRLAVATNAWYANSYAYNGGAAFGFKAAPNNFAVMST